MLIADFQIDGFRFIEIEPYTRHNDQHVRRFNLQQWCPLANRWYRVLMPGNWFQNFASEDNTPVSDDQCIVKPALLKDLRNPPKAVIVCPEKHGTQYFSANSTEEIGLAALHLVKERYKQGYYSLGTEPVQPDRKPEDFPDSPKFAAVAEEEWTSYDLNMRYYREEKHLMDVLDRTLAKNHYSGAVHVLESHSGYEYEGFRIELLTPVEMNNEMVDSEMGSG